MADKVDVLAVMDEVIALLESQTPTPLNLPGESHEHPCRVVGRTAELRAARNVVAGLINASDKAKWGLYVAADVAWALADLQKRGLYMPKCSDGKPSRADAAKDLRTVEGAYAVFSAALATLGGSR